MAAHYHNHNAEQATTAESVTLINVFEVSAEHADAFVEQWSERAKLLSNQPGFLNTALHRAAAPDARFQFVNVAHWHCTEQFEAAMSSPEFQRRTHSPAAGAPAIAYPALYHVAAGLGTGH